MSEQAGASSQAIVSVLICDDNEQIRRLLRVVIDGRPSLHVVAEAADGNEAISEATRHQPNVILLDLAMPRRTGLEALVELGRVAPNSRVIVLTGFSVASVGDDVQALGAVHFLSKGVDPEAINDAIEMVAAQTTPVGLETRGGPAT